jgi:hypothetical protein
MAHISDNNTVIGIDRGKEIVALRDREFARQGTFRSHWQSTADLIFPQTIGITTVRAPGEELMTHLFDTTGLEEAENTSSNIVSSLFPPGQRFFTVSAPQSLRDDQSAREYLPYLVEQVHEQIFNSNYISQVSNTVHYWFVFGTGSIYSDWTVKLGLNYRDYAIGTYQCLENAAGVIDAKILTLPMTAAQIVEKFGEGEAVVGRSIQQAYSKPESRHDTFNLIHYVGPRDNYDHDPVLRSNLASPVESVYVAEKDKHLIEEGGFDEFPFAIPRYQVIYGETYGRGRGTMLLPKVRQLNRRAKDYDEMSNKWVNPPKEVLESFEGTVDVTPGALNYVVEKGSIAPIDMGAHGAYPVTKDILEYYREGVREGFLRNAFEPITPLKGDRRNTTEILERMSEGLKKQARPFGRLFTELLTPLVIRTIRLLVRNGVVAQPPDSLRGTPLKIEFVNPLALALRDQQAKGGQRWVAILGEASQIPQLSDVMDNVNGDMWARDLGESLGVKADHIKPVRQRDAERQQRAEAQQAAQQAEMMAAAADSYQKTTKAPEPGSPLSGEEAVAQ